MMLDGTSSARTGDSPLSEGPRERITRVARRLFYEDGIQSTGVNKIIEESVTAKATFYKHFPSKNELIEEYLEREHDESCQVMEDIEKNANSFRDRVDEVFASLESLSGEQRFRGCAFALAAAQVGDSDPTVRQTVENHKLYVTKKFEEWAQNDGVSSAREISEQLSILYDGALLVSALRPSSAAVQRAHGMAIRTVAFWV
jgi:AcrR family transcriptional regulator